MNDNTGKIFEKGEIYKNKVLGFCGKNFNDIPSIEKKK